MSKGQAKLFFIVALVINCILFSQSRYGRITQNVRSSLMLKRTLETSGGNGLHVLHSDEQCRPIILPPEQQCAHVRDVCSGNDSFLSIPYLQAYFCSDPSYRPFAFAALAVWLVMLFSTLGISASDFFCPNLATIAQTLGLDENVAGVTFLAFGNGSPDVFSTFSAMKRESGTLAIGELFGAASFIVSCVVGSMCIIKPFRVDRYPFLRDVGFFATAVSILILFLWDGMIRAWEAATLVGLYVVYVVIVVVGSWLERKQEKNRRFEARIRDEYRPEQVPQINIEPYHDDPGATPVLSPSLAVPTFSAGRPRAKSHPGPFPIQTELSIDTRSGSRSSSPSRSLHTGQMPSFSLIGALEFRQVVSSLQNQAAGTSLNMFGNPLTPYLRGHYPHHHYHHSWSRPRTPVYTDEVDPWDTALGVPMNERSPSLITSDITDQLQSTSIHTISQTSLPPSESDADSQHYVPPTKIQRAKHAITQTCHILFPTLRRWRGKTFMGKIVSLFAAPAVMALTLTLPVVVTPYNGNRDDFEKSSVTDARLIDFEEEGMEIERALIAEEEVEDELHELTFNKWLMAVQSTFGPLFCVAVLFNGAERQCWLLLATGIGGVAMGCLVAVFAINGKNSVAIWLRTSMGFLIAMVWIMAIADEVVGVLQTFGFIFGLSDAIIGITIFAVGNSTADLVANMSVAVFAPVMGFSACFGGPMLNILLGVGIASSYLVSQSAAPYILPFSATLMVSGLGLLSLLLLTVIFVPLNGYFLTRKWGIFLICSYIGVMTATVVVELTI